MPPTAEDFRKELNEIFAACQVIQPVERAVLPTPVSIEITSGARHRRAGGNPGRDHRRPVGCQVMRPCMVDGEVVVHEPPSLGSRCRVPRPPSP